MAILSRISRTVWRSPIVQWLVAIPSVVFAAVGDHAWIKDGLKNTLSTALAAALLFLAATWMPQSVKAYVAHQVSCLFGDLADSIECED